jgi:hypothetical protein
LLKGTKRIDALPQLDPFAMAARESTPHKQTEMTIPSQDRATVEKHAAERLAVSRITPC